MSMGPLNGIAGSAAGTHRAQSKGSDVEKSQHDTSHQARRTESQKNAEKAAGIGQTEHDEGASDRDADGRRLWEDMSGDASENPEGESDAKSDETEPSQPEPPSSRDPSGTRGTHLDLQG